MESFLDGSIDVASEELVGKARSPELLRSITLCRTVRGDVTPILDPRLPDPLIPIPLIPDP